MLDKPVVLIFICETLKGSVYLHNLLALAFCSVSFYAAICSLVNALRG